MMAYRGVRPRVHPTVFVAETARVIGDVEIGQDSSVWFGAVVRGDCYPIRIGARSNLQDNVVVHVTGGKAATTIGSDVTVGHLTVLHGCEVRDRCLIGMGSVVLDGAVVEEEVFLAAGSLVAPGVRLPSRSLAMGRPAKVVRALSSSDLDDILQAAALYVGYSAHYREGIVEMRSESSSG